MKSFLKVLGLFFVLISGVSAESLPGDPTCQNAQILGPKIFTDVCWACLFPIKVAGVSLFGGTAPDKSSNKTVCACSDNNGIYRPGLVTSMWQPARLVEVVRSPGCSMALGGANLAIGDKRLRGHNGSGDYDSGDTVFYNVHYYSFPLLQILEIYLPSRCNIDGFNDFDLISISEIDPTWTNPELAFFTHPEAAAVSSPIAQAACTAEALTLTAGQPLDSMWWCAGSWGAIYPFAGHTGNMEFERSTSLLAAKTLAVQHRRGLARLTMGDEALCKSQIFPTVVKSQYKLAMFSPLPETARAHWIGEHPMKWNGGPGGRLIPFVGEDALYMLWRWADCCATL
ncbi:hypothetical protein BLL42_27245 (plasmid) [Pseudomonas frederiksbergensis]|uniref:Conjugal transfer protein TraU n=1 Tax=Pseudomonas frederiksbergensis TaxID=104087 RepID=A0A1J0ETE6_9PSED|nr:TraU family protein [Pseudomonas frederiksbergensis]APC19437.1 hypothetical protein BLL42_27245 [Pseudomonas frederiksbergensis]